MVQMVREGAETGYLPSSSDFIKEFEVSRRTVARDLDFLRDEERAPLVYDDARHGFRLTDETYTLPPVRISRREAFSFALARKLLAHYEDTPLHLDMRSVLDKIAESLEGDVTIEPDWLSEHVGVLPEDRVRIDPAVWSQLAGCVERREAIRATYQTFDGRVTEYELHPYHLLAFLPFRVDWRASVIGFALGYLSLTLAVRGGSNFLLWPVIGNTVCFLAALLAHAVLSKTATREQASESVRQIPHAGRSKE